MDPDKNDESLGVLRCSQVNNQHSKAATLACCERLLADPTVNKENILQNNEYARQIALVQEPYVPDGKVKLFHKNLKVFCSNVEGPRACIITNNKLKCFLLNQFSNRDQATVLISFKERNIIFCSLYCPGDRPGHPADPPPSNMLKNLVKYSRENNIKLICGSDCNSHNECWGSTDNNKRGIDLMDYFLSFDPSVKQ